ncbi:sensor histidine kinase [Stackebrandtia nassauensis]|uniref:histidine kinase n=1 Tax=Stackebrandtia nassauensis (strain DSM 44728 / CIP 108903 / NRRL B-16338 / NBRC 102104 / LLR-40K-21) TaxID=446470 RepID=D3Q6H7_STANL|nr:sensor histidine kinase [Stackebrandtia nassauensis]ADD44220.1 histidine kinase [Stackebrandtia nassauensis DSM 44728]
MRRVREFAGKRPVIADVVVAVVVAVVSLPATVGGDTAAGVLEPGTGVVGFGWLWFVAVHVPLTWRRRAPVVVFWTVLGLVAACALAGMTGVFFVFAPLVALYTVARHRSVRRLWPAVAAVAMALGVAAGREPSQWPAIAGVLAVVVAVAACGIAVRVRRALLDERARRAREELERQAKATVASERERLAREVHDIVAHNLAVMVALADGAALTVDASPAEAGDMMGKSAATGREALGELRRLVRVLRDGDGQHRGGEQADVSTEPQAPELEQLVERVREAGLHVELVRDGEPVEREDVEASVYRIVQESLTNVLKHAGAEARARVQLRYEATGVEVTIVDNGAGQAIQARASGGHGLAGIAERAKAHGGEAEAGPVPGGGWQVRVRLPFADGSA